MVFMSNPRVTFTKAIHMIVTVFLIPLLWRDVVSGMKCCSRPDINLTVECVDGRALLNWSNENTRIPPYYLVKYGCNSSISCYIYSGDRERFSKDEVTGNITNPNFGNSTCWFWMKNMYPGLINDNRIGCSEVVTCNPIPNVTTSSSMIISKPSVSSSPSTLSIPFLSSSVMSSASILSSLSSYSSLTKNLPTSTTTATATATIYTATPTTNTVTVYNTTTETTATVMGTPTSTSTVTNATETTTASINPSTSVASFENTTQDIYSLLLYITVCCAVIIIVLLVSACLFACWRKCKRQQLENYQIEDVCCEDHGELAKESDSETETLANGNGIGDDISITDDDMYMLRKILHLDILSLEPSIFTDNEADDGSVASHYRSDDGGSHYCGSGGHCLQSNTSSSNHRNSSCSSIF